MVSPTRTGEGVSCLVGVCGARESRSEIANVKRELDSTRADSL